MLHNESLRAWLLLVASHTSPSRIHWCDGSERESEELYREMVTEGALTPLHPRRYPNAFLHRSDLTDVIPLEQRRFVCVPREEDAGPTNQWLPEEEVYRIVWPLFAKAMQGRTLFVAPYLLGPPGSKYAQVGIQLTDSPLAVLRLGLLTRMGRAALEHLGRSGDFVRGLHCRAEQRPEQRFIVHFPLTQTCWSIGSDQTDSAVMGHKWHALNMLGAQAPEEGYLAEHMSVARVTTPAGTKHHVAAAFPSGSGKTQLATLASTLPGWSVELVADGMCFLRVGDDCRLWALNLASGIDGSLAGGNGDTPGMPPCRDVLFSDAALQPDGTPWWEGCGKPAPANMVTWHGMLWQPGAQGPAAHPRARFTTRAARRPGLSPGFHDPEGVPISAILFGGKRSTLAPLVFEATSWEHGVYVGATSRSEAARGASGEAEVLRNDPMAMLPFCAYNMGDYFSHWLRLGRQLQVKPRIFHVNWFRTDQRGGPLWPGFGDNVRVLQWVIRRVERALDARRTPIGFLPQSLDMTGLALGTDSMERLLRVDVGAWLEEVEVNDAFLSRFGQRLPAALRREHEALVRRLRDATN